MEKILPIVIQNREFEYHGKNYLQFLVFFDYQDSDAKIKINKFNFQQFFSQKKVSLQLLLKKFNSFLWSIMSPKT